jgi:4'-phosphopantetheinyl transferase
MNAMSEARSLRLQIEGEVILKLFLAQSSALPRDASTELLVSADQADIDRLSRSQDKARLIKLRNLRRMILSQYLGLHPKKLEFFHVGGKPALVDRPDTHFSTASSGDHLAVAISDQPVGVDIEIVDKQSRHEDHDLSDYLLHPTERQALMGLSAQQWKRDFYLIWTQKEAYSKARGLGFGLEFDTFAVAASGGAVIEGGDDPSPKTWYTLPIARCWPLVLAVAQAEPISDIEPIWFEWPLQTNGATAQE